MTAGIRLGRVVGAPVVADVSAFILVLLFMVVVLIDLQSADVGSPDTNWVVALVAALVVLATILIHEVAHAVVAIRRGLHVRMIRLQFFGGYSVIDGDPDPPTEVVVSIAGPIASLFLGVVAWFLSDPTTTVGRAAGAVAIASISIGVLNMVPGFPLDGGRVLRGLLAARSGDRAKATARATLIAIWFGYAAIGAGVMLLVRAIPAGLLVVAFGWFLASGASAAGKREQLSIAFDGMTIRDAMRPVPEAVPGNWTISTLVEMHAMGPRLRSVPVEMDGHVVGVIGEEEIENSAPARWPSLRVRALMTGIGPEDLVDAGEPLESLMLRPAGRSRRAVVVDDGVVVGIIEGADLAKVMPEA